MKAANTSASQDEACSTGESCGSFCCAGNGKTCAEVTHPT